ncbi:hypothetical protein ABPG77_001458 [Micractinium sp. CCAP 211/92]
MRAGVLLCALAAFAGLGLAAGGPVATDTYTCSPATCKTPSCLCASNSPPGGLTPQQIPQFILISHDNALDMRPYEHMLKVLGQKKQRNGCTVPVTWFAMRYHSDCAAGRQALARGDEVAMQANRFFPTDPFNVTDDNPNYDSRVPPLTGKPSVEREITMSREWWNKQCGLPLYDMIGFRAQGYYNNPPIRDALSKNGWLYDSTLIELYANWSATSPSADQILWPYTMDAGIPQDCQFMGVDVGKCNPGEKHPGLWEVPLYQLQDGDTLYGVSNYGDTELGLPAIPDLFELLKGQLDGRIAGGRGPFQISTFYEWLSVKPDKAACATEEDPFCFNVVREVSENGKALARFIDYAVTKPEVRFVTYSDLIRWMQNPVPLSQFDAWQQCNVTGVKADLTAVNLTEAEKAGAFYLTGGNSSSGGGSPAVEPGAAPAPAAEPGNAPAPAAQPEPGPTPDSEGASAPSPAPADDNAAMGATPAPMRRRLLGV